MHNLTLTNMNFGDPNSRFGDMKLMDLASWMTHDETRVEEVKKVMEKEEKEQLYIKAELVSPNIVTSNHNLISNYATLAPKYIATQEKSILHFLDTFRLLGTESLQGFQRRWHGLLHSLQIKEYHSPERLRIAFKRTRLYKRIMQRIKIRWRGLKLIPPLLLGLQEGRDEVEE